MARLQSLGRIVTPITFAALLAIVGCSTVPRHAGVGGIAGDAVTFPNPAKASRPEGTFVNLENLRKVEPGLTKDQLYDLLGAPHFNEGVIGVKKWNYIFDFRKSNGLTDYFRCQYQIVFDKDHRAQAIYWKPEGCKSELDEPAPAVVSNAVAPMPLPEEPIRLSGDTMFAFDRADLTNEGRQSLGQFLQRVQQASRVQDISIIGYTDRLGSDSYNLLLSQRRADSVKRYLVDGGIPAMAMRSVGRGNADPVVQCSEVKRDALIKCLAPNRRVELSGVTKS
jgi:OOP family OmpA-OmpF porin